MIVQAPFLVVGIPLFTALLMAQLAFTSQVGFAYLDWLGLFLQRLMQFYYLMMCLPMAIKYITFLVVRKLHSGLELNT